MERAAPGGAAPRARDEPRAARLRRPRAVEHRRRDRHAALPDDERLAATVHYYSPFRFTHQGAGWLPEAADWLGTAWGTDAERARVRCGGDGRERSGSSADVRYAEPNWIYHARHDAERPALRRALGPAQHRPDQGGAARSTPTSTRRRRGTATAAARRPLWQWSTAAWPRSTRTWRRTSGATRARSPATASTTTATAWSMTSTAGTSRRDNDPWDDDDTARTWPARSRRAATTAWASRAWLAGADRCSGARRGRPGSSADIADASRTRRTTARGGQRIARRRPARRRRPTRSSTTRNAVRDRRRQRWDEQRLEPSIRALYGVNLICVAATNNATR